MATVAKYKLNGAEFVPPREHRDIEILATFDGDSVQANITTSEFSFVNVSDSKPVTAIDNWFSAYPTEGMPIEISIANGTTSYPAFKGYLDFRTLQYKSDIERICGIKQDNGLVSLDERLRGITMELLKQKGAIVSTDYINIPYVVENRKTLLERIALLGQFYIIVKTSFDEVHKFVNIASDITTLGAVQALINLTVTTTGLVLMMQQLADLLVQIQESFFPPVRYHKGITLKTAIQRAVQYCGYSLDCGSLDPIISKTGLCPSKDDEVGNTSAIPGGVGILKPQDFGYVASDLFALSNMMYYTKVAIIGNTVHLKPFNDPFWVQSSTYQMPNVKIEQAFVNNGIKSINYDELKSSRILQYSTDDSDLWTLTNVSEQISVTTVTPISVISQNRVLLTGSEQIRIPYALAVRKDALDDLIDLFTTTSQQFQQAKDTILFYFNQVQSILGSSFPALALFTQTIANRTGCMKVENHFFSIPKIVYLESDNRIPVNYSTIVGAVALSNNYHSYKSFVPGVRNPSNPADTNAKDVYTDVTIPMGIDQFNQLITNSYFTTVNGDIGKFTSIKWKKDRDKALTSFWVQSQWAVNIEENTI